jgi:ferredoxin
MARRPAIDLGGCNGCGVCVSVCPEAFAWNDLGFVEVLDSAIFPEDGVDEAIVNCPEDCIYWEEE